MKQYKIDNFNLPLWVSFQKNADSYLVGGVLQEPVVTATSGADYSSVDVDSVDDSVALFSHPNSGKDLNRIMHWPAGTVVIIGKLGDKQDRPRISDFQEVSMKAADSLGVELFAPSNDLVYNGKKVSGIENGRENDEFTLFLNTSSLDAFSSLYEAHDTWQVEDLDISFDGIPVDPQELRDEILAEIQAKTKWDLQESPVPDSVQSDAANFETNYIQRGNY